MENNGWMIMLPIESLRPNPDNPRKDLGDLSELTESIKVQGVLQNLTVVPEEGFYTVVIGHRRLEAAKQAGLEEIPCTIADMTKKEQIATMLTENMQRADLTIYEQAKAFQQLSLDLGMPVSEISEKSGFSETTVRKRIKLAEYDEKSFYNACKRGATLFDFEKLEKLEDPKEKGYCLSHMGTNNFENEFNRMLEKQENKKKMKKWIEQAEEFAYKIDEVYFDHGYGGLRCAYDDEPYVIERYESYSLWFDDGDDIEMPEETEDLETYFYLVSNNSIDIFREKTWSPEEEEKDRIKEENRRKELSEREEIESTAERHMNLRREFVLNFGAAKSNINTIMRAIADSACVDINYYYTETLCEILGITYDNIKNKPNKEEYDRIKAEQLERLRLILAYCQMESKYKKYFYFRYIPDLKRQVILYQKNEELDLLYSFLEELGYQRSDEELQLAAGTHPLFYKFKEESEDNE